MGVGEIEDKVIRRTFKNAGRKVLVGVLAGAAIFAATGVASADPGVALEQPAVVQSVSVPVAGDIATDPNAQNSDPLANGVAAGAGAGAIVHAVICMLVPGAGSVAAPACAVGGALNGALLGLLVGALAPHAVPQVLP